VAKKFPVVYENSNHVSSRFILILFSSFQRLSLPDGLFPWIFPIRTCIYFGVLPCMLRAPNLILSDSVYVLYGEE
jgi:hypothetical protein